MTKPVCITVDSTCDLTPELQERFGIRIIPLTIILGSESYLDGVEFTPDDLYRRYREDGMLPQTSAPGVQEYLDFFTPLAEAGNEVVHLTISTKLSNSFNAARLAAGELEGVHVVDSRALCCGVSLLAIEGAECRDRGMAAADIAAHLDALTAKVETSFVLDSLEFMRKGGRCTGIAALGANLLHLKPALEMRNGRLEVYKKYRGATGPVYTQYIRERLDGKRIRPGHIFLANSGGVDDATLDALEALIRELIPVGELHRVTVGCTISSHCGPKTLAVMFIDE